MTPRRWFVSLAAGGLAIAVVPSSIAEWDVLGYLFVGVLAALLVAMFMLAYDETRRRDV